MSKYLIILLVLLSSCGARKVSIVKNDTKTKTDSISVVRIDSTSTIQNNIVIDSQSQEIEISPIDNSKEIFINNIPYKNARIRIKNTTTKQSDTSLKKVAMVKEKAARKTIQKEVSTKEKQIDKKVNYFVYLWLLLIPVGMYIYRQIKNKLFL